MTNKLSPAAQAVLDAVYEIKDPTGEDGVVLAAALRAAVNQVISPLAPPCADFDEYAQGFLVADSKYRNQLLAIATELENQ